MINFNFDLAQKEDEIQEAVFSWASYQLKKYPELSIMYHVPNGGKRNAAEAKAFKRRGVRAGVPDICLPVPSGKYHGAYIELKTKKGRLSDKQKEWLKALSEQGYFTKTCYGFDDAIKTIEYYLNL